MNWLTVVLIYFAAMSFVAFALTMYDKLAAQAGRWRIPENVLMLLGFLGGATGEYVTMQLIRHKTRHKKFMVGLPIFIAIHIAVIALIALYT